MVAPRGRRARTRGAISRQGSERTSPRPSTPTSIASSPRSESPTPVSPLPTETSVLQSPGISAQSQLQTDIRGRINYKDPNFIITGIQELEALWPAGQWCPPEMLPTSIGPVLLGAMRRLTKTWIGLGRDLQELWAEGGIIMEAIASHNSTRLTQESAKTAKDKVLGMVKRPKQDSAVTATSSDEINVTKTGVKEVRSPGSSSQTPITESPPSTKQPPMAHPPASYPPKVFKPRSKGTKRCSTASSSPEAKRSRKGEPDGSKTTTLQTIAKIAITAAEEPPTSPVDNSATGTPAVIATRNLTTDAEEELVLIPTESPTAEVCAAEDTTAGDSTTNDVENPPTVLNDEIFVVPMENASCDTLIPITPQKPAATPMEEPAADMAALETSSPVKDPPSPKSPVVLSTVQGTVKRLRGDQWLTGDDIERCCRLLPAGPEYHIFSPQFPGPASKPLSKPISGSNFIHVLHQNDHWSVVHLNRDTKVLNCWNSYSSSQADLKDTMDWLKRSDICDTEELRLRYQNCPQQEDTDNCGVYCVVFVYSITASVKLPPVIDPSVWRKFLATSLEQGVTKVPFDRFPVSCPDADRLNPTNRPAQLSSPLKSSSPTRSLLDRPTSPTAEVMSPSKTAAYAGEASQLLVAFRAKMATLRGLASDATLEYDQKIEHARVLRESLDSQKADVETKQSAVESLMKQLEAAESELQSSSMKLEKLEEKVAEEQRQIAGLQKERRNTRQSLDGISQELLALAKVTEDMGRQ